MGTKAPFQLLSTNEVGGESPPLRGGDKGEGEKLIPLTLPSALRAGDQTVPRTAAGSAGGEGL